MVDPKYIVVSAVRNEAPFVKRTLASMARQDAKPLVWLLVDDGSTDDTVAIVRNFAGKNSFIRIVEGTTPRDASIGGRIVAAFNQGYDTVRGIDHDFVVKLDCDLSFDRSYFSRLFERFNHDPSLGIASGVYLEPLSTGRWKQISMPPYHAAGASKAVRRECFEQIGGFVPCRGWDTVDEIRAMTRGWTTKHFPELRIRHWKVEGSRIGALRTSAMHGEVYYRTRGSLLFLALKIAHRALSYPWLVSSGALAFGYARAALRRSPRLVNEAEGRYYRALLKRRLLRVPRFRRPELA